MRPRVIRSSKVLAISVATIASVQSTAMALQAAVKNEPPALVALRDELARKKREDVVNSKESVARYRPLCDKDGYPLVGNVARKAAAAVYQPSQFCSDVRKAPKSS